MNRTGLKFLIFILSALVLCSCTSKSNKFTVVSDYDYFKDAGGMGFYKKGDLYGFIRLNGDSDGLKPFALDKNVSRDINLESIKYSNGYAIFSAMDVSSTQYGFMDLHGNTVMKPEWGQIRLFGNTGFTSVFDNSLNRYIIIDSTGKTIRDSQSYIEFYPPNPDIFICNDTFDDANSNYYILDKELNILLEGLDIYFKSGRELAHTRQYTIFGVCEKFIFKKDGKFFMYDLKNSKTIGEFENYDDLLEKHHQFIEECQRAYSDYEHPSPTESVNGILIHYEPGTDKYTIVNENGETLFEPNEDITGLSYRKGKVILGTSKSTGKTVAIFSSR